MLFNFLDIKSCLLSGLYCSAFCFVTLALQVTLNTSAMGQDALDTLGELAEPTLQLPTETPAGEDAPAAASAPAAAASPQDQQRAALNKRLKDALFDELDKLVPGDQAKDSPAGEALLLAVDAFTQRKNDKAYVILEQAAASQSNFPPADLLMAGMYMLLKNQNNGLKLLQAAATKSPNDPAIYAAYGRLASAANRNVDAKVHFEKLYALLNQVELDEVSKAHYKKGYLEGMALTATRMNDHKQARLLCEQLLEIEPENENTLQLLATIAFQEDKFDEALTNLTKVRNKRPTARAPEAVIASWLARTGQKAKANQWYSKLPVKYADDPVVQLEYAAWALNQEDIAAATAALAKVEAAGNATPAADNLKGKIAFFQRNFDDAVKIFKALHETNPKNPDYSNMYALSMIESESSTNKALANQLANKNWQDNPNNLAALGSLGYMRLRTLGVNDQLKSVFAKIAKMVPRQPSPEVDYFLATFLRELGDKKNAIAVIHRATQYQGFFMYRKQAEQMKQALAAELGVQIKQ